MMLKDISNQILGLLVYLCLPAPVVITTLQLEIQVKCSAVKNALDEIGISGTNRLLMENLMAEVKIT